MNKMNKINDHFLIGDLHSAALVSKGASINWLCFPHFDSSSLFGKILDKGAGEFSIEVKGKGYKPETIYMKNTPIVKTMFKKPKTHEEVSVKDFMVPQPRNKVDSHILVRKIHAFRGSHEVRLIYKPRIDYGEKIPKIYRENGKFIAFNTGKGKIILHVPEKSEVEITKDGCVINLKLNQGETEEIILENCTKRGDYGHRDLEKKTRKFWQKWVEKGNFFEFCRERLIRSAITLKLMQFYTTGALIAAPTTSLPEAIKGNRNWDYRYVWIRDATFTIYAFYVLGYTDEAKRFFNFIEKISKKFDDGGDMDLVYTIDGKKPPKEKSLKHLSGYKNSKPVRIGNDASKQFQLDVYGVLIDSYYFMLNKGFKISSRKRKIILHLVNKIEKRWKEKDSGIWEFRENIRDYTYSKVSAWVGINRAIRICDMLKISNERKKELIKLEEEIKYWIWENCYDLEKNKLVRSPENKHQDSTNFLFVLLQFLNKKDPISRKIIENTRKELAHKKVFVHRYKENDEFKGKEGAFVLCSFWMISALAIMERVDEAEKLFRKFEEYLDENGLISEEIDSNTGDYLGNYPQAFSHMGYIMSAYYIDKYKRKLGKARKKKNK